MEYLKSIIFKIHALAKGLFFGLMVTTAWMAYRVCESAMGGSTTLPPVWEGVLVVGAALVVTYLIDNALYQNAVAALAQTIKQKGIWRIRKEGSITTLVLLLLLLGRFFFSGGATYLTGESTVTERQTTDKNIKLVESLNSKKEAALSSIRQTKQKEANRILADAKAQAQEIKQTAETLARKKVETAIAQGSTTEQEAYKNKDWVRASYSKSIKKAKQEAYLMEEKAAQKAEAIIAAAQSSHKATIAGMEEDLYRERNSSKWQQLETEVDKTISAQMVLWTAERWTYYLLDFILVVGGFFCSWLIAVYIVKTDATIETFFPDKPGISDVIGDMIGSVYAYIVTSIAVIPAYFKQETSRKMVKVAKSVGKSSASYNSAIAEYIVASHPAINAQVGATAHHNAMLSARERIEKTMKHSPASSSPKADQKQGAIDSATVAQRLRNEAQQGTQPIDLEVNSGKGATAQHQAQRSATGSAMPAQQIKKSGSAFRSYLSQAGRHASAGGIEEAMQCLNKARLALPDDHLKTSRLEKIRKLENLIDE